MPCYRCGARQADPARGARPWLRAVRAEEQVLVCPECQQRHGWSDDVDHCPVCGGTRLVRRLGKTVCRACEESATAEFLAIESTIDTGASRPSAGGRHRRADSPDLSSEVATAIERILGRSADKPDADPSATGR